MSSRTSSRDLGAAVLVTVVAMLPVALFTGMAVQITSSLHVAVASVGIMATIYYAGAAGASVPGGRVAEAIGGGRVMRASALAEAVLMVGCGTLGHSAAVMAALLVVAGIVAAAAAPATNLFVARRFDGSVQGTAFGIKQAAVPLAQMVGGLAVPVAALTIGWRWAFVSAGGVAAVASLAVPPSRIGLVERRRSQRVAGPVRLDHRPLVLYATGIGCAMFASSGLTSYSVVAAVAMGLTRSGAGIAAAVAAACAVATRVTVGAGADRTTWSPSMMVVVMLLGGAGGFAVLVVATEASVPWLFVVGLAVSLGLGWGCNGLFNYVVVARFRHAPAAATGVTQLGARIGGVLGPVTVGFLASGRSYMFGWVVAMVASVLAGACVWLAGRVGSVGSSSVHGLCGSPGEGCP